jgi:hypothetical protein
MNNALILALKALYSHFMDRFTPDAAGLVASLSKIEAQIEKSIDKSSRDLAARQADADGQELPCDAIEAAWVAR